MTQQMCCQGLGSHALLAGEQGHEAAQPLPAALQLVIAAVHPQRPAVPGDSRGRPPRALGAGGGRRWAAPIVQSRPLPAGGLAGVETPPSAARRTVGRGECGQWGTGGAWPPPRRQPGASGDGGGSGWAATPGCSSGGPAGSHVPSARSTLPSSNAAAARAGQGVTPGGSSAQQRRAGGDGGADAPSAACGAVGGRQGGNVRPQWRCPPHAILPAVLSPLPHRRTCQVACKKGHAAQEGGAEQEALQACQPVGERGARHSQQRDDQHLAPRHPQQQRQQLLQCLAAAGATTALAAARLFGVATPAGMQATSQDSMSEQQHKRSCRGKACGLGGGWVGGGSATAHRWSAERCRPWRRCCCL